MSMLTSGSARVAAALAFVAAISLAACGGGAADPAPTPQLTPAPIDSLPPSANEALGDYVQREHGGELVGECTKTDRYGWCFFKATSTSEAIILILGRVGAGLPTWRITLKQVEGSYRISDVQEVQGKE